MLYRMTVYVYGGNLQASNCGVTQLTIPQSTTGFHLKKQLLKNHADTNYVLLYNNKRIDGKMLVYRQIPNFASITLCALGVGGGKDDEVNVSGNKNYICFLEIMLFNITDECISCGEDADMFCSTCQSSRCNTCNDLWHSHKLRRDHVITVSIIPVNCTIQ